MDFKINIWKIWGAILTLKYIEKLTDDQPQFLGWASELQGKHWVHTEVTRETRNLQGASPQFI